MHVIFLGHAGLHVRTQGINILIDPWFSEPVFGSAWWRYPPPPYPTAESLPRADILLLSHIHPDHSGPGTLAQIDSETPTYAQIFASGALKRRLAKAQYRDVTWLNAYETREIAPGVSLTFVPHDQGWEVSSLVIQAEDTQLYHGNDNPLSIPAYREVVNRLGQTDIAFLPFAGGSSYPTCFEWDFETISEKGRLKKTEGIKRLKDGIEGLQPKWVVPFASNWALLEEKELWKNYMDRPTALEAAEAARPIAAEVGSEILLLDPGDEWDSEKGVEKKGLTAGWDYDASSIARYAKQEEARVGAALAHRAAPCADHDDAQKLGQLVRKYFDVMLAETMHITKNLRMVCGFIADGIKGGEWHVVFEPGKSPKLHDGLSGAEDETLTISAAEFCDVLAGDTTWEDLWYGYRLRIRKRPEAKNYGAIWQMLLSFDDEALSERLGSK